jgi:hypothetical protein
MQTGRERESTDDQLPGAHCAKDMIFVGVRLRVVGENAPSSLVKKARFRVMSAHDHRKNPDSVQNQGSLGGKGRQTSSQGKREKVLEAKGCCVRLLTARDNVSILDVSTHGSYSMRAV